MAATLTVARDSHQHHLLRLPPMRGAGPLWQELKQGLSQDDVAGPLCLVCADWRLRLPDLEAVQRRLGQQGLILMQLQADDPETRVAAAALGLEVVLNTSSGTDAGATSAEPPLTVHQGTLRSGDHLEAQGSVLVLGDVNPGARISAGGHVLIWGRLRGVAHAGRHGDDQATIVALQMRPLQLRIAAAVARGPDDGPAAGLCEEARLVDGEIRIDPAVPHWPLKEIPALGLNVAASPSAL